MAERKKNEKSVRPAGGGPMGKGHHGMMAAPGMKLEKGTIPRLLTYLAQYKVRLIFVIICILVSAAASVASSLFLQSLIDDYILPMLL